MSSIQTGDGNVSTTININNLALTSNHAEARQRKVFSVKRIRNQHFTGRKAELEAITQAYVSGSRMVSLVGLGGIGKTQIAVEFAFKERERFSIVWWSECAEAQGLESSLIELSKELNLETSNLNRTEIIDLTIRYLEQHDSWLLILNNVKNPEDILHLVPSTTSGRLLITSRNPNWHTVAEVVEVKLLPPDEANEFIERRTNQRNPQQLSELLQCLPLALEQACAYIVATGRSIQSYIDLFAEKSCLLFSAKPLDYEATLQTTWEISSGELILKNPSAMQFLSLCSLLGSENIYVAWFENDILIQPLKDSMCDQILVDRMLADIKSYSLMELTLNNHGERIVSIHSLVQAVCQSQWTKKQGDEYLKQILVSMLNRFAIEPEFEEVTSWDACSALLPHVLHALQHAMRHGMMETGAAISLATAAGQYAYIRGLYEMAEPVLGLAVAAMARVPNAPKGAQSNCINSLAVLYREIGKYDDALKLAEQAMTLKIEECGEDSIEIVTNLNNVAVIRRVFGRFEEAEGLWKRAISMLEKVDSESPELISNLSNLAELYLSQLRADDALPLIQRASSIASKTNRPQLRSGIAGLFSNYYWIKGDNKCSLHYQKESLKEKVRAYGVENVHVATSLNNIGVTYGHLQLNAAAESLMNFALNIRLRILPANHPALAESWGSLAMLSMNRSQHKQSETQFKKALAIFRSGLCPRNTMQHVVILEAYSKLLEKVGRVREAHAKFQEASSIRKILKVGSE